MTHKALAYIKELPTETLKSIKTEIIREINLRRIRAKKSAPTKLLSRQSLIEENTTNLEIKTFNSSGLYSVPDITKKLSLRHGYYLSLLAQDWSETYQDTEDGVGEFYVYAHVDPAAPSFDFKKKSAVSYNGKPFYIGKGCGDRAYNFKRNQGHGKKIKSAIDAGWGKNDIVKILFSNLSEAKSLEIEAKLIYFFGTIYEKSRANTCLYNLDIPKTPLFVEQMQKIKSKTQLKRG